MENEEYRSKYSSDSNLLARDFYNSLLLQMRYVNSVLADTGVTVYGKHFASPFAVSSLSHLTKFGCGEGAMVKVAQAAAELNILHFSGSGDMEELEAIVATGVQTVKIIKPFADHDLIFRKIEHAENTGCLAVGMDIDHIFTGAGTYDSFEDAPLGTITSADLREFVKATKLPFVVKGVLSEADAYQCAEAGVGGIFCSHHHGIAKFMAPPAMMLPELRKAVGEHMPIFIDGNVESGYDCYKALALGANVAAVGRPLMKPVKEDGVEGVTKWFSQATAELCGVMSRTGCASVGDIDESRIVRRCF